MGKDRALRQRRDGPARPSSAKEAQIEELKRTHAQQRQGLSLSRRPIQTLRLFGLALREQAALSYSYAAGSRWPFAAAAALAATLLLLVYMEGPDGTVLHEVLMYAQFISWWCCLGIASSIGLGSGLHTFVLYLGPHIARYTLKATACGHLDLKAAPYDTIMWGRPGTWNDKDCSEFGPPVFEYHPSQLGGYYSVPLLQLIWAVQLEAVVWGIGTAIGELPPYFVSRAARLSGDKVKELEELEELEGDAGGSVFQRLKLWMFSHSRQLGFFAILAFASVPNPLFDLAGITCGHFLVPFWKFFTATVLGKAVVKTHLQTIFIALVFNSHSLEILEKGLEWLLSGVPLLHKQVPFIMASLTEARQKLSGRKQKTPSSRFSLASAWNTVVTLMLLAFLASIVSSTARGHLIEQQRLELKELQDTLQDGGGEGDAEAAALGGARVE